MMVLPVACKKTDFASSDASAKFDVAAAKEWWYGRFRKSSAYTATNIQSAHYLLRMNTSMSTAPESQRHSTLPMPAWKRGVSFKVGSFEMVDLPLVASHVVLPLPLKDGETETDRKRTASASLHRLLMVKKANGEMMVRVVTVMPSLAYLKRNDYSLPFNNLKSVPNNFEGIISIKGWDETEIISWKYNGTGKRKIALKLLAPKNARLEVLAMVPCPPIYDIVDYHYYCIYAGEATEDEPVNPCDLESNWVRGAPIYGWVYPEGSCDDGTDNGDACDNLTPEQCTCLMYGLGCEGAGTGGGSGEPEENIIDSLKIPCLSNSLALVAGGTSINNAIGTMVQNMFGSIPLINIRFKESNNLPPSVDGEASYTKTTEKIDVLVKLNSKTLPYASKEYVVATILHESLHAINMASGVHDMFTGDHMDLAIMVNEMKFSLMSIFPNLPESDARALAWGGLEGSGPIHYGRLSPSQQQLVSAINSEYKNRASSGKGTICN